MGASQVGHPCARWLWLSFRWAVAPKHPGRILRLFRRGHREEETVVADLEAIGIKITRRQERIAFGSHVSGSIDGVAIGVPEAPKTEHLLEIKTHSAKSFADLKKHGVEKSKPQHWVQMQVYMLGLGLERALYVAVCKDTDEVHTERIHFDAEAAMAAVDRAMKVAVADRMPPPISTDPAWHECAYCPAREFCHAKHMTDQVNCRTCVHSTAKPDNTWRCERHDGDDIPVDFQREGCGSHILHPDLVPPSWQFQGLDDAGHSVVWITPQGRIEQGTADGVSSLEIVKHAVA
jgi:hypothetical protein